MNLQKNFALDYVVTLWICSNSMDYSRQNAGKLVLYG